MKKVLLLVLVVLLFGAGESIAQSSNFGKNKVQYKDFKWHYIQSAHFDIYYYQGGYELAQFCAETAEKSLTSIEKTIRYDITQRIAILVYISHNDFQQTNAVGEYLPEGVGGVTELFKNRVVVPFEGNYELFRHVIHHELVHAVLNDMYAGGSYQSLLTGGGIMIPTWMNEGLAEYESLGGLDIETDMFMRDATLADAVPPLERLGGYVQYRVGQTMYWYVSEKYGPEKVAELLQRIRTTRSPELAYRGTFGIGISEFGEKFLEFLKKIYFPDIARFDDPANFAEILSDHKKLGNFYNSSPEISPKGDYVAFISDRSGYYDIYVQSIAKPSEINRVVSGGGATGNFEELHLLNPGLTWSPDEKKLALASKAGKNDVIHIIDIATGNVEELPAFDLDAISQVMWSPDGKTLALNAYKNGGSDIYLYDFASKTLTNLTNDAFADQDVDWSNDSKSIYFSSDRGDHLTPGEFPPSGVEQSKIGTRNKDIYRLDIDSKKITRITNSADADETKPVVSIEKKTLFYISNKSGINNIFASNLDGTNPRPLTNSVAKIDQISISDDGSKLVFSAIRKGGYNLYLMRNPLDRKLDSLPNTKFRGDIIAEASLKDSAMKRITDPNRVQTEGADSTQGYGEVGIDLHNYVYGNTPYNDRSRFEYRQKQPLAEITNYKDSNGKYFPRDYKVVFTPDIILGTAGYTGYYGLQGSAQMLFSDELGNHQLYFATNFLLDLRNSDYVLSYFNLQDRVNFGLQAFHSARFLYTSPDPGPQYANYSFFVSRFTEYGLTGLASYPLDRFNRVDLNFSALVLEKDVIDNDLGTPLDIATKRKFALAPSIGYVHDDVIWSYFYPKAGTRYNLSVAASPGFGNSMLGFVTPQLDFRHYFRIIGDMTFVARLSGAGSWGPNPQKFFLGGVDGWINRYFSATTYPLTEPQDFAFYATGTPLRGFPYNQQIGTKYGLMNLALRFPFPIFVSGLPLALLSEAFVDAGTAWDNKVYLFQKNQAGGWTTKDLLMSTGIGLRTYLFGIYLKMDVAWTTTIDTWAKPQYIFSLGEDF